MPITEIDRQLIEKHLDKSLSEPEQAAFDERLADADFATELALYQKSIFAIHAAGDINLKAMLQLEESMLQAPPQYPSNFVPKIPTKIIKQYGWAMAASFLIAVSVGYWFFTTTNDIKQQGKDRIFADNFKPYIDKKYATTRSEGVAAEIDSAFSLYFRKDYLRALTYFEKINSPLTDIQFTQANAYLATHQLDKAIPILEKISQDTSAQKQQAAEWYLALALSETQLEKAKRLFEKIKSTANHSYQQDAIVILK